MPGLKRIPEDRIASRDGAFWSERPLVRVPDKVFALKTALKI